MRNSGRLQFLMSERCVYTPKFVKLILSIGFWRPGILDLLAAGIHSAESICLALCRWKITQTRCFLPKIF